MRILPRAIFLAVLLITAPLSLADSEALYQRCAACHLPDGAGIPGSFPPLKNRIRPMMADDPGRSYLVNVINVGLIGAISVAGVQYMGAMPAQGHSYSAADISELLNYMAKELDDSDNKGDWRPFTETEVLNILDSSSVKGGHDAARERKELMAAFPKLR